MFSSFTTRAHVQHDDRVQERLGGGKAKAPFSRSLKGACMADRPQSGYANPSSSGDVRLPLDATKAKFGVVFQEHMTE